MYPFFLQNISIGCIGEAKAWKKRGSHAAFPWLTILKTSLNEQHNGRFNS